jgi:hypothetical protein
MNHSIRSHRRVLVAAALTSLIAAHAFADTGLKALSDDRLISELARRNLPNLLDRAFEQNQWPQEKRKGVLAVMAAEQLRTKSAALSFSQKQSLVQQVTQGISSALPTITDPQMLFRSAETLMVDGIRDDIALLEYWGASSTTQVRVKPVIDAVTSMLERSTELLAAERGAVEKQLETANVAQTATLQRRYGDLLDLDNFIGSLKIETDYNTALAIDKADPRRAEALNRVIEQLTPLDTEDNPARNAVRFALAKAQVALGTTDSLKSAKALLDAIAGAPSESDSPALPFESRYFRTVADVVAQDKSAAQTQYGKFTQWLTANKPSDPTAAASVEATAKLLQYRVTQLVGSPDQANKILIELVDAQPQFREVILQQLLSGVDKNTPLNTLDPLILSALVDAGRREVVKTQGTPDEAAISKSIAAARELVARKGKPGVQATQIEESAFVLPFLMETQGDKIAAANAFLDYADQFRTGANAAERGPIALDNGMRLIGQARAADITDPAAAKAYDRVFPIALSAPYNRKELTFTYANLLNRQGKAEDAAKYFRQIAASDPNFAAARYLLMISLAQKLDTIKTGDSQRATLVGEIQTLAAEVRSGSTGQATPQIRERLVRTNLLSADLARVDQNNPAKSLDVLKTFEENVKGMNGEDELLGEAMFIRVQAYMQLQQTDNAVKQLVDLLQKTGGARGAQVVFNMLTKLEEDFTKAQTAGDSARMAQLQSNRAALTPYLVQWASRSTDTNINKFTYSYRVYDAETQRLAADFIADAAQRRAKREESLARFKELDAPEGFKQFQATLPPERVRAARYDPQVALGIARLEFELDNFAVARDRFARLLADKTLGLPVTETMVDGQVRETDNESYWEALFKWSRASQKSAKEGDTLDNVKTTLRSHKIRWEDRMGGTKWKEQFATLMSEVIGG